MASGDADRARPASKTCPPVGWIYNVATGIVANCPGRVWTTVAAIFPEGYPDQAHEVREVNRLAPQLPTPG